MLHDVSKPQTTPSRVSEESRATADEMATDEGKTKRYSRLSLVPRASVAHLLGNTGTSSLLGSSHIDSAGDSPPPALDKCRHHLLAVVMIAGLLGAGIAVGLNIDTSGGSSESKLGASISPDTCTRPTASRLAPKCERCTCCSNAATGAHSSLRCAACAMCCKHCPNCHALAPEHADCLDADGKVIELKGRDRGWYCVPSDFDPTNEPGKLPLWFSSVLDYNPFWQTCPADELPSCEGMGCQPLVRPPANASLVDLNATLGPAASAAVPLAPAAPGSRAGGATRGAQPRPAPQTQPRPTPQAQPRVAPQAQPRPSPQAQPRVAPQAQPRPAPQAQPRPTAAPRSVASLASPSPPQAESQAQPEPTPAAADRNVVP